MKILSVFTEPDDSAAWVRISSIARLLRAGGHEVDFLHFSSREEHVVIRADGDGNHIFAPPYGVKTQLEHLRFYQRNDYDLIYGNTHNCTFKFILAAMLGAPLVFDMHGGLIEEYQLLIDQNPRYLSKFYRSFLIDKLNKRFSRKIMCVSKTMLDYLSEEGIERSRLAYVTNGIDLEQFSPIDLSEALGLRKQHGLDGGRLFGYVGAMQRYQGVHSLVEAANNSTGSSQFLIVGGDENQKTGNITFLPKVPRNSVNRYYAMCDVLVLPRPHHPATDIAAPTKLAEYSAMGKPILTTDVGDAGRLVKKYKCGVVIDSNKPKNLAHGIDYMMDLSNDDLQEMGQNSRNMACQEFDWDIIGKNLLNSIESIEI